jgi:glycosyltransferase involved in cell wall biosynthesis
MSGPVFSVIMPAYNAEATLGEAIESVLSQTYEDFELLVVDDCSADKTKNIIEFYKNDLRLRSIFLSENLGVAGARNKAIKEAKGRYIAFLDADDVWLSEKLELQKAVLDTGCLVVFSSYRRFGKDGDKAVVAANPIVKYSDMLRGNCIGNLTGVYDCFLLGKVYQKKIGHEDYLMWLEVLRRAGEAKGIEEVLAKYRVSSNSVSANKFKSSLWVWAIYREHLGLNILSSIKFFSYYAVSNILRRF